MSIYFSIIPYNPSIIPIQMGKLMLKGIYRGVLGSKGFGMLGWSGLGFTVGVAVALGGQRRRAWGLEGMAPPESVGKSVQ